MKLFIFFILLITEVYADSVKIKVNPEQPLINETFNVEFIVSTSEEGEPIISFNPLGFDVVSRSEVGTSTRMTIINGQSSIERSMSVSYELMPTQAGTVFIRDIEVEINGKTLKHKTVRITVLKKPKQTKKIFVRAEVSKEKVYVGESILVRYYLYNRADIPLAGTDIKRFPKLDKFLKRFHQEPMSSERVRYDGKMYVRRIMYTAQLFGQKPGTYKIDPISMKVSYSRRGNPFGGFGGFNLQIGRPQSTSIMSPPVEIEVISLPANGLEPHFSGLVGNHEFKLTLNKNKFISNEPIELKLSVEGDGALELFEAPLLLSDPNLEEFEKSMDLVVRKDFSAQKKIEYTYLGRGDVDLTGLEVPISYFDPEKNIYVTKKLKIGDLKVAGVGQKPVKKYKPTEDNPSDFKQQNLAAPIKTHEFKPILKLVNTFIYSVKEIFLVLISLLIVFIIYMLGSYFKNREPRKLNLFDMIYKNGVSYSNLYKALSESGVEGEMQDIVDKLDISQSAKSYFKELVDTFNNDFSNEKNEKLIKVEKRYFKELENMLENSNHE